MARHCAYRWRVILMRAGGHQELQEQDGCWFVFTKTQAGAAGALAGMLSRGLDRGKPVPVWARLMVEDLDGTLHWEVLLDLAKPERG